MKELRNSVYYGNVMKLIAIVISAFSLFVAYVAYHAREDQRAIAFLVALFFLIGSLFLLYQAFFVRFWYDDNGVYYRSPKRLLSWLNLVEKGYSRWMDMNYLRFEGFGTLWVSAYMVGFDDFSDFLEQKIKEVDSHYQAMESTSDSTMKLEANNIIQRLSTTLSEKYPHLQLEQEDKNFFIVKATNETGFDVWLNIDNNEWIVGYNGWHEHIDDAHDAYDAFLFGLTPECRLRVTIRGSCRCSYVLEAFEEGGWRQYGSTVYPLCCMFFWRTKRVEYLSNDQRVKERKSDF